MIRLPDMRYFELHGKCAAGTLNPVERIELDALCAIKEAEWANCSDEQPRHSFSEPSRRASRPSGECRFRGRASDEANI